MTSESILHSSVIHVFANSREHYDLKEYFLVDEKYTFIVSSSMWDSWEKSEYGISLKNAKEALEKMILQQIRTQTEEDIPINFTLERDMSAKVRHVPKKKSLLQRLLRLQ